MKDRGLFLLTDMQTPPPQKCPHQKVIVNGAQRSESNGKNNKKNSPIFIFRVVENWGDFSEK